MSYENLNDIVESVLRRMDILPNPPREHIKKEFIKMKEMIMDNRPPRILILGRRGAGKSSIINAIFNEKVANVSDVLSETGKPKWYNLENADGTISILDTRGIGDLTKPESAKHVDTFDEIKNEIKQQLPDVVLFLCKARDVDSHIAIDIQKVQEISNFISKNHKYKIPIAALITNVDVLTPKDIKPPYENEEKKKNISTAVKALNRAFKKSNIELIKTIPVSAYAEHDSDGIITLNNYWNIDKLIVLLSDYLPNSAQVQLARLSKVNIIQVKIANTLIRSAATICSGIAATPVPGADIIPITAVQVGMVIGIANIAGRKLSKKSAKEFLTALGVNVGTGFALREVSRALIKYLFPGGGLVISAAVAFAGTMAIGTAASAYFIEKKSIEEAKNNLEKVKKEYKKLENSK